jgi:hypothetical protein
VCGAALALVRIFSIDIPAGSDCVVGKASFLAFVLLSRLCNERKTALQLYKDECVFVFGDSSVEKIASDDLNVLRTGVPKGSGNLGSSGRNPSSAEDNALDIQMQNSAGRASPASAKLPQRKRLNMRDRCLDLWG